MDHFLRGNSRLVALVGYPVAHSVSPLIHNHAFRTLDLPYCYIPLAVPPGTVHVAAALLRHGNFAGANVTIPHKGAIVHYCDQLSALSEATGTVNTLYRENGMLCGTTTDTEGFIRALAALGTPVQGADMVILGNGGTARTLSIALAMEHLFASLCIVGRNEARIAALAAAVHRTTGVAVSHATTGHPGLADIMERCTLLVNCTNVGMHPNVDATPLDASFLHAGMTVFDAIYNPSETRLLRDARAAGCVTENGLRMLLYQGLASFRFWTGVEAPEDIFPLDELQQFVGKK